jgi:endo-1,3-1,4-beta-glycanase ExoK
MMLMANRHPEPRAAVDLPLSPLWMRVAMVAGLIWSSFALGVARADDLGQSFFDDFETFDPERWYISDGWSNGEHQNCQWSSSAVTHVPGTVVLSFVHDPTETHAYRCGEIQTNQRFSYGTYEARLKTDDGSGLNAAFFTYIGPVHGERHDEIDFEILTASVDEVTVNTFVDGQSLHGHAHPLPRPANEHFIVYSFIWEPGRLRWFVDGDLIRTVEDDVLPERPQKIYLSIWGTETLNDWMGPFEHPDRPKQLEIDWVAFTAPGESCQFDGSVLCTVSDD